MTTQTAPGEAIEVEGDSLLTKVKEVVHDGNVRRIRILYEDEDLIDDAGTRRSRAATRPEREGGPNAELAMPGGPGGQGSSQYGQSLVHTDQASPSAEDGRFARGRSGDCWTFARYVIGRTGTRLSQ
jgi:hypothetical protein